MIFTMQPKECWRPAWQDPGILSAENLWYNGKNLRVKVACCLEQARPWKRNIAAMQ